MNCAVCDLPLGDVDPHELDDDELCHPDCCPVCDADRELNALRNEYWP